ncbi:FkbM family methyltransferase [Synechococcus sp. PCC 7502]|uniref:FkbM family methyltransferase n=1 Tax=Synechococcus sp. PCC 7502 TaxID=1173263 RepID=UPI001FEDC0A7|nr:FkbM family methyltransferase [Synechococcus sp. PCC 7502]
MLKELLIKYKIYSVKKYNYHELSFSQEGEDRILARIFEGQESGFYIDIGAHHPQRFSNTYLFYLKGWRGINIDAMPKSMDIFNSLRPRDINLEIPISENPELLTYYEFDESALNTFSLSLAQQRINQTNYKLIFETQLQSQPLAQVLDKYLPKDQTIDFLNIDVEGLDYQVLISNNWEKYRPRFVLVEDLDLKSLNKLNNSKIYSLLQEHSYILVSKTINTLIFQFND